MSAAVHTLPGAQAQARSGGLALEWCRLLVRALVDAGVSDVVVSPGSRSTPLVLALAETAGLRMHAVIDERAAGFFALGMARVSGRTTALVCTSGSAGAHYFPAVIEAAAARLPVLVLTADRPPELQHCGASQTIDQTRLFGVHVRASIDLGPPDAAHTLAAPARPRRPARRLPAPDRPAPAPARAGAACAPAR